MRLKNTYFSSIVFFRASPMARDKATDDSLGAQTKRGASGHVDNVDGDPGGWRPARVRRCGTVYCATVARQG